MPAKIFLELSRGLSFCRRVFQNHEDDNRKLGATRATSRLALSPDNEEIASSSGAHLQKVVADVLNLLGGIHVVCICFMSLSV